MNRGAIHERFIFLRSRHLTRAAASRPPPAERQSGICEICGIGGFSWRDELRPEEPASSRVSNFVRVLALL